ncbi:MAG: ribosome silencing factor [Hyphomicrobiales bacterium]
MTIETEGSLPRAPLAAAEKNDPAEALATVLESLDGSKAEDIVTIDLNGKTTIGDYMVVASGRSHRHVGAVADHLLTALKDAGFGNARVEGLPHCDWVLVDAGDIIVHLFRPEVRSFYNIEKMWSADRPADVGHA